MAKSGRRQSTKSTASSRESRPTTESYDSFETYESRSTAPSSYYASTQGSVKDVLPPPAPKFPPVYEDDISPNTSCCPRSSTETYDSRLASEDDLAAVDVDMDACYDDERHQIPPLPVYRRDVVDPDVRPSTPQDFAKLFPSTNRLSIRHDEFTPDGNMNLRVDTVVPGRRRLTMQLFHLRMYDLAKREFSLRRYCRDSGREVCNAKRRYVDDTPKHQHHQESAPTTPGRSVTSALKSLSGARKSPTRTGSGASIFGASAKSKDRLAVRPGTSSSSGDGDDEFADYFGRPPAPDHRKAARPVPSNTIKLEFSNYARVDVTRRGAKTSKRYEFDWWGHRYQWNRVVDKNLGVVSFHLVRHGTSAPVAHIVPETRSPDQVLVDDHAGGWVPPCYMWISDKAIPNAATDVADVIVATGLIALVDDCIKDRWGTKPARRIPMPLTSKSREYQGPMAFINHVFHRRNSDQPPSPLRHAKPVSAY